MKDVEVTFDELNNMTLDEKLDALDDEIMKRYPEIENAWLYFAIAEKVKLEIARHDLLEKQHRLAMSQVISF